MIERKVFRKVESRKEAIKRGKGEEKAKIERKFFHSLRVP